MDALLDKFNPNNLKVLQDYQITCTNHKKGLSRPAIVATKSPARHLG